MKDAGQAGSRARVSGSQSAHVASGWQGQGQVHTTPSSRTGSAALAGPETWAKLPEAPKWTEIPFVQPVAPYRELRIRSRRHRSRRHLPACPERLCSSRVVRVLELFFKIREPPTRGDRTPNPGWKGQGAAGARPRSPYHKPPQRRPLSRRTRKGPHVLTDVFNSQSERSEPARLLTSQAESPLAGGRLWGVPRRGGRGRHCVVARGNGMAGLT